MLKSVTFDWNNYENNYDFLHEFAFHKIVYCQNYITLHTIHVYYNLNKWIDIEWVIIVNEHTVNESNERKNNYKPS